MSARLGKLVGDMTVITESRIHGVVRAAEALLSQRAGSPVTLADPEDLGGSGRTTVVRVRVAKNPLSMGRTLVIKALPDDEEPHAFHREIASYKYATALPNESRPGPQIIASDPQARVLVLTDLGHGRSMSDLLDETDGAETLHAVSAWGQALGRMHAATVGGENDFMALLRRGSDRTENIHVLRDHALRAVASFPTVCAALGVEITDDHARLLLEAACTLFDDGDHRAFSPSDVGPENIMLNESGVQFMDYEWGGFRDATLDIAYALVTCGALIRDPDPLRRRDVEVALVDAWRSEVATIWPSLSHDRELVRKVATARLLWVWMSTVWMLPTDLDGVSDASASSASDEDHLADLALHTNDPRVLVSRWADLAAAAARYDDHALADIAGRLGQALSRDWLD